MEELLPISVDLLFVEDDGERFLIDFVTGSVPVDPRHSWLVPGVPFTLELHSLGEQDDVTSSMERWAASPEPVNLVSGTDHQGRQVLVLFQDETLVTLSFE